MMLAREGVAVLVGVLDADEIQGMQEGMWETLSSMTAPFARPVVRGEPATYGTVRSLMPHHGYLFQGWPGLAAEGSGPPDLVPKGHVCTHDPQGGYLRRALRSGWEGLCGWASSILGCVWRPPERWSMWYPRGPRPLLNQVEKKVTVLADSSTKKS